MFLTSGRKHYGAGFTYSGSTAVALFELLVVLVVAGILTVFFVYSAQYLITTTRVSRVREEQRVLSRALQNYEADYAAFPGTQSGLHALYAPVAYMVRIPNDPFSGHANNEYVYISSPGGGYRWLIISQGPDRQSDLLRALGLAQGTSGMIFAPADDRPDTRPLPVEKFETLLTLCTYDPTNGLVSGGDIITANR